MSKALAIANQKGGVGKTTTAVNLGASLAVEGKRVLLLDMDPQGNAGSSLGVNGVHLERTVYEVLIEGLPIDEAAIDTPVERLSLVPAGQKLIGAEIDLVSLMARETRLKRQIDPVRERFDYIIIDSPPSLGLLTVNILTAADSVLVPIQCEYYALEGLSHLLNTVKAVQQNLNPSLRIEGVLLTMFDSRLNLSQQVADEARKFFSDRVFKSVIPRNVRLGEAPSFGKPVILYDPHCVGAESYSSLAREVLAND